MAALTKKDVHEISSSELREDGKLFLSAALGWETFGEDQDMRRAVLLDYLFDNCQFAIEKGFTVSQVNSILRFSEMFLKESNDISLSQAVILFRKRSESLVNELGERNFKLFCDFTFSTYMRHFQLFKLVFTCDRMVDNHTHTNRVVVPPESDSMSTAKENKVWEYEQQIKKLEQLDCENLEKRNRVKSDLKEKSEKIVSEIDKENETGERKFTEEDIEKIVRDAIGQYSAIQLEILKNSVEEVRDRMETKFERVSIPRPAEAAKTKNPN